MWRVCEKAPSAFLLHETEAMLPLQGSQLRLRETRGHESLGLLLVVLMFSPKTLITGALKVVRMLITECPSLLVIVFHLVSVHLLNIIVRSTYIFPISKAQVHGQCLLKRFVASASPRKMHSYQE